MKFLMTAILVLLCSAPALSQYKTDYTEKDVAIFNDYCSKFKDHDGWSMNKLVVETGKYFLDTPYVNFTLEAKEPEELIVNLRELDCVTFVETTIALARTIKSGDVTFENYCNNLRELRYRGGELKDFTSRLHYFSDWIADKEAMGMVEDQTERLGGDPYPIKVNLMSKYPKNYRQLVNNPEFIPVIAQIEDSINKREMFSIPRERADRTKHRLREGYLIATTTPGMMDVTHVGFVCNVDGKPHFMHASSTGKKVMISEGTLKEYLESVRTMTGFMAVKVLEPDKTHTALHGDFIDNPLIAE